MSDDRMAVLPNASCPMIKVSGGNEAAAALRNKAVVQSGAIWAQVHRDDSDAAQACWRGFTDNVVAFTDGESHRGRRKLLNQLVRPDAVDRIRDEIVTPQARALLSQLATGPGADGKYRLDLSVLGYRTFLHFTAKFIGLSGVDTDAQMARLAGCVAPLMTAIASAFYQDRAGIMAKAEEAKKIYVEEFYLPALAAQRALLAEVDAGNTAAEDVPPSFMNLVASGAHPEWEDQELAIRDSVLLFAASVGSSTQSIVHVVDNLSRWFAEHPEDHPDRTDYDFLLASLQEVVRMSSPFSPYVTRMAEQQTTVGGESAEPGQEIRVYLPTANRDTDLWGPDAGEFNPRRVVPEGWQRHGIGFSAGAHQCLGQRVVLGGDGTGGVHVRLLQALYMVGVAPDPENPSTKMARLDAADPEEVDVTRFTSYPVVLDQLPSGNSGAA